MKLKISPLLAARVKVSAAGICLGGVAWVVLEWFIGVGNDFSWYAWYAPKRWLILAGLLAGGVALSWLGAWVKRQFR